MKFKNSKRQIINVDVDGILTNGEPYWEVEATPNEQNVKDVIALYEGGHVIIIHTARLWSEAQELVGWLIKHGVPYHGISMNKGMYSYCVDDRGHSSFTSLIKKMNEKGEY